MIGRKHDQKLVFECKWVAGQSYLLANLKPARVLAFDVQVRASRPTDLSPEQARGICRCFYFVQIVEIDS
jgi:hypothetical protein